MNRRVRVQLSASTYEYLFDPAGRRLSSWLLTGSGAGAGNEGRIWWDGGLLATRDWNGQTYFHHSDWLGTERMRTNYQGQVTTTSKSWAFGDGLSQSNNDIQGPGQDNDQYAGLEHDEASFSEHATFRQYSSTQGRWMSPDPYDGSYNPNDPQSFNRYSYVLNNPFRNRDPRGLTMCDWGTSDQGGRDTDSDEQCEADGGTLVKVMQTVEVNGGGGGSYLSTMDGPGWTKLIEYTVTDAPNKPPPTPTPPQPQKLPWYCGAGNSWSHPFTAPTSRQWGMMAAGDAGIALFASRFGTTVNPVTKLFATSAALENYAWAACGT